MDGVANIFDKFGIVVGLMILIIAAIVYLFMQMQAREKDHDKELNDVRDKYEDQLVKTTAQIEKNNTLLEENTKVIQNNNKAFETFSDLVRQVIADKERYYGRQDKQ